MVPGVHTGHRAPWPSTVDGQEGVIMPRKSQTPVDTRPAFTVRLSPGDQHTYTWDGGPFATVYRHAIMNEGNGLELIPTGDVISMEGVTRTATAFSDHIRLHTP